MTGERGVWRVELVLPAVSYLPEFDVALEALGGAVTAREIDSGPRWQLIAHCVGKPDHAALRARIAAAAASAGIDPPPLTIAPVPETDWVAAYRERIGPVSAGSFFVYPTHYEGVVPAGRIGIRLDAGLAFGTGEHETTKGCLAALDRLNEGNRVIGRALDLGCGSAILAIAMAKLWPQAAILAVDNDPEAVRTASGNVADNGCGETVTVVESDGYRAECVGARAPYDLIAANILARPLIAMAGQAAAHLAPAGHIILSGFVREQAAMVQMAHEDAGLRPVDRIEVGDWTTLILARPG